MQAVTQGELGRRVADARQGRGWTQGELAGRVGLTQTAVSRIETGARAVSSVELAELAEALDVSVLDLLRAGRRPILAIAARLGRFRDPGAVDRALKRAEALTALDELLDGLLQPTGGPPTGGSAAVVRRPNLGGEGPAVEQGRRLAEWVRRTLRLGDGPLLRFPELLEERFHLDVDLSPLPEAVDGLCVGLGDRALVLVGSRKPSSRQRFTLAHELAHYLVDDLDPFHVDELGVRARGRAEMRANAFAAHLLMPEAGVRAAVSDIEDDAERAVRVALSFGTSVSAAAYQLGNLGLLPDAARDRLAMAGSKPLLMRYALPSDWQQDESGRDRVRPPSRLYGRATLAYRRGLIGLQPIAELLQRSDHEQLRQELDDAGLAPDVDAAIDDVGSDLADEIIGEMAPGR
jgi:Zn-dependent peptidase ImmA (M78 family)/transcriptional regulator with XRE-family HTH domain